MLILRLSSRGSYFSRSRFSSSVVITGITRSRMAGTRNVARKVKMRKQFYCEKFKEEGHFGDYDTGLGDITIGSS